MGLTSLYLPRRHEAATTQPGSGHFRNFHLRRINEGRFAGEAGLEGRQEIELIL